LGHELQNISDEALDRFNRQIRFWPSNPIAQKAMYQSSVPIRDFLVTAKGCAI
jgi:hypothetical protein